MREMVRVGLRVTVSEILTSIRASHTNWYGICGRALVQGALWRVKTCAFDKPEQIMTGYEGEGEGEVYGDDQDDVESIGETLGENDLGLG